MARSDIDTLKKAAFLHDLGKVLNWAGELHLLDGARVLQHLGFDDPIVGVALYHEPGKVSFDEMIDGHADCAGLKRPGEYDPYSLALGELVDKLMAGFDRIGDVKRTRPIVLRNPLTHLPMKGDLRQFEATRKRASDKGPDADYLREFVRDKHLPDASLKPWDADKDQQVYQLDDALAEAPLLQLLADNRDAPFNELYRALHEDDTWQTLTRRLIPQGHHPPTDTLALWYHMQFSSAMMGLYWAEGFRSASEIEGERERLWNEPLEVKIGLLYVHLSGLTDYFATAYRLPDFSGTQAIAEALKETVKQRLLDARHDGEPFIWEDSFLYEGHDDFLVMVPVAEKGAKEGDYTFHVDEDDDPFRESLRQALSTAAIVEGAVEKLLSAGDLAKLLACPPDDARVFGDGRRLRQALENLVSVELSERCFAEFEDGSDLRPLFGVVWNRLRAEARGRLRHTQTQGRARYYAGDVCDACRVNLAGHDPDPSEPRDWPQVDWERDIIRHEYWANHPLHYWVFRGADEPVRGEGDKLCHACLLRRILGSGTSLEEIAPEEDEEARIAVIKGNVNRTQWFIRGIVGPSLTTYRKVWFQEVCLSPDQVEGSFLAPWVAENIVYLYRTSRDFGNVANKLKSVTESTQELKRVKNSITETLPKVPEANQPQFLEGQAGRLRKLAAEVAGLSDFLRDTAVQVELVASYLYPTLEAIESLAREIRQVADSLPHDPKADEVLWFEPLWKRKEKLFRALERAFGKGRCDMEELPALPDTSKIRRFAQRVGVSRLYGVAPKIAELQFVGSPTAAGLPSRQDGPTPSRTMTVSWLIEQAVSDVEQQVPENEADVIYADGDEFLVVCPAEMAPQLARRISRHVLSRLNAVPEDRVEQLSDFLPVTLAMGVVAAKRKHPMYGLLTLVDRLVQSAKTDRAKGTAIDFENVVGGVDEEYLNRETFGEEWLSERPLPLRQFGVLMEDVEKLREGEFSDEDKFPARQLQQIAALIADVPPPHADRRSAALAYVWQPHEGEGWENVRRACEDGTFQDLMTLWRWPQQVKEEEEDN